jgi:hypothetical protein
VPAENTASLPLTHKPGVMLPVGSVDQLAVVLFQVWVFVRWAESGVDPLVSKYSASAPAWLETQNNDAPAISMVAVLREL